MYHEHVSYSNLSKLNLPLLSIFNIFMIGGMFYEYMIIYLNKQIDIPVTESYGTRNSILITALAKYVFQKHEHGI